VSLTAHEDKIASGVTSRLHRQLARLSVIIGNMIAYILHRTIIKSILLYFFTVSLELFHDRVSIYKRMILITINLPKFRQIFGEAYQYFMLLLYDKHCKKFLKMFIIVFNLFK